VECKAPGCGNKNLIQAHIIPAAFARTLYRAGGHNKVIFSDGGRRAQYQNGEFDNEILCHQCDNILGALDRYGFEVSQRFPAGPYRTNRVDLADVCGEMFARFVLSVLWRASISTRPTFETISLGPYEEKAGRVIFQKDTMDSIAEYQLIANRYSSASMDTARFFSIPVRSRLGALNAFGFGLGGFQLVAKFDKRPLPSFLSEFVVNRSNRLLSFVIPLENTDEYKMMSEAANRSK
jgi:hypothetical protein